MKPRVHYAILEDMKKYINGFNSKYYERTGDTTDQSVIEYVREYYHTHLPVDVTAWMRVNEPNERLIYKNGLTSQACFIRNTICELLYPSYKECEENPPLVISTHTSKSVLLPVYQINLKKYGIEMVLRYNFYDWKISVKSDKPLDFDFIGLFDPAEEISKYYCEGFPIDKIYGSFSKDTSKFTVQISDNYKLYTFIYLLKTYLGIEEYK